jgi:hypothetical protein
LPFFIVWYVWAISKLDNALKIIISVIVGILTIIVYKWSGLFSWLAIFSAIGLILVIVRPNSFSQAIKKKLSRGMLGVTFGSAVLIFAILSSVASPASISSNSGASKTSATTTAQTAGASPTATTQSKQEDKTAEPTKTETPKSPEPTPTKQPEVPADFKSALNKATSYSNIMHMSKRGVYDQLVSEYGEKFSAAAAQYAIDNIKADWNANALAKAKSYQDTMNMSPAAVHDQLTSENGEKFTQAEADYAIQHLND